MRLYTQALAQALKIKKKRKSTTCKFSKVVTYKLACVSPPLHPLLPHPSAQSPPRATAAVREGKRRVFGLHPVVEVARLLSEAAFACFRPFNHPNATSLRLLSEVDHNRART